MTAEARAYEKTILVLNSCRTMNHYLCAQVFAKLYMLKYLHYRHSIYIQDQLLETKAKILNYEKARINN